MTQSIDQLIEPLTSKSLAEFAALIKLFFNELNITPEFHRHDQDVTAPLKIYAPPRGNLWLARHSQDEKAVGMAAVRQLANRTCELKRLFVMPEYRRKGIGQNLLNTVFEFGREQEYMEVLVSVSPAQKAALALYEKNGFNYCARYNDDNRAGLFLSFNYPTDF